MAPWDVLANQDNFMGPARWFVKLQVLPPSVDDVEPTSRRHVEELQFAFG